MTTTTVLTPSELAWLHADQIAPPKTFNDWSTPALLSDTQVSMKQLAQNLVAVALLANEQAGALRLEARSKKALFGLRTVQTVFAEAAGTTTWPNGSLEDRINDLAHTLQGSKRGNEVQTIVHDLFSSDVANPWGGILEMVGDALQARGLIGTEQVKRLKVFTTAVWTLPDSTRELAAAQSIASVKALLEQGQARADIWKTMMDQIQSSLKARVEQDPSDGRDFDSD